MPLPQEKNWHETFWSVTLGTAMGGALLLQACQALHWGQDSWPMTEWLINYSGGFVRRGLPGEILLRAARATHLGIHLLVVAVSLLLFAALAAHFVRTARGRMPLPLLFSGLLLGAPAYAGNAIRKDALLVLGLVLCLKLLHARKNAPLRWLALNAVIIVLLLSHEAFFFLAVPALFLSLGWQAPTEPSRGISWWALAVLAPALLAMAFVMHFHGNAAAARAIDASLLPAWSTADPVHCCSTQPQAAIDSLQWSSRQGVALSAESLHQFSHGIWAPLAWAALIGLVWFLMTAWLRDRTADETTGSAEPRAQLAAILLLQLACIAPLFAVGRDFGRWIFLWAASSLVLYFGGFAPQCRLFRALQRAGAALTPRALYAHLRPRYWYLLVLGLPTCCWTVPFAVHACPAGYYLRILLILAHRMKGPI